VAAPCALAEALLDGTYYKVTYSSKGATFANSGVLNDKARTRGTCYTKLVAANGNDYEGDIACETGPDVWALMPERFDLDGLNDGNAIGEEDYVAFDNDPSAANFEGYTNALWTVILDKYGNLRNAKGIALGGVGFGTVDGGSYVGDIAYKANFVKPDRVPQGALDLLGAPE
jgi:hypothetical protein